MKIVKHRSSLESSCSPCGLRATVSAPPGGPVRDAAGKAHPTPRIRVSTSALKLGMPWLRAHGLQGLGERETREKQGPWSQVTGDPQRRGDLGVSAGNTGSNVKQA